jgi:hypothetical protein
MFNINDKVKYITIYNKISDDICTIIEILEDGKIMRLRKPNGEVMRIFNDRIRNLDEIKEEPIRTEETNKFNPFNHFKCKNVRVWVKQSHFNTTVIMKSFIIVDLDQSDYYSINTYNDVFNDKFTKYSVGKLEKLITKIEKKDYTEILK